ncbi:MAG TPA: methyltransferase domain-containing protein [Bryobacteraceae bacterium]|nr:methyltransferase domain-containing protein [Bryobacteraceae bacterium]
MSWNPALYENQHSFVWKYGADLLPLLDPKSSERILDIGCGTGQLTAAIAESGADVLGIDSSVEMIGQARQNYPDLKFRLADARELTFLGEFDAVFSNAALHWILDAGQVVQTISNALIPGGRFVAEFGGKGNIARILTALRQAGLGFQDPWYFPSIGEYTSLLESHGFEVRFASHFDRLTPLEGGGRGLRHWIEMFASNLLNGVPAQEREQMFQAVEETTKSGLYFADKWHADYRRIRISAIKID